MASGARPSAVLSHSTPYETAQIFRNKVYSRPKRLNHYRGNFYQWAGGYYRKVENSEIRAQLYRFLNDAVVRDGGELRPFCPDDCAVNKVIDALKAHARIASELQAPAWLPDANPQVANRHQPSELLPCTNRLLDLNTGDLLPHTPSFLTMNAVDYSYNPAARAPRWEQFIAEILPDDVEAQETLQEIFGYMLTADTRQQKIFMLVGRSVAGRGPFCAF
jgi:putative DNA primase/helicase